MAEGSESFAEVMVRLRTGDETAAGEVFRRYARRLIGRARLRLEGLSHKVDAEDVVQSVYKSFFHRFAEGRKLILGGVEIPHDRGLDGHSDADVLSHAVADALLGAMGEGDIGKHFPNTDETIRGINSLEILGHVRSLLAEQNARATNVDATVIAEEPKLQPHIEKMRSKIAHALACEVSRVNIKATTNEGMGALGRGEGIAVMAVASVEEG